MLFMSVLEVPMPVEDIQKRTHTQILKIISFHSFTGGPNLSGVK